ncbi:hypothetical protein IFM89_019459 [Coptis chinensis]|uniref:Uncharacterized protein n=1 Tax=Coptis chinensis TaxID=261450 RepID=A0A835H062_9MAGN|nr:hypothetical protein IFM89_019459 [Coptis chinensis]
MSVEVENNETCLASSRNIKLMLVGLDLVLDAILIGILWDLGSSVGKHSRQNHFLTMTECCLIFGNDYATGEEGNSGFDDDMVDGGKPKEMGVTILDASESSLLVLPQILVLSKRWQNCRPSNREPQEEEVDQIDLLKDALQSLPDMNLSFFLKVWLDFALVENDRLIKVFLGLKEDIKASWLFRRLEQAGR